jgi:hypothetical protein
MIRRLLVATTTVAALFVAGATPALADDEPPQQPKLPRLLKTFSVPGPSGAWEFRDIDLGSGVTECPQARMNVEPDSLRNTARDDVEKLSDRGDDHRANTEYSCFPQDETSIDVNPTAKKNLVAGANDYRLGWASSGFYASSDGGQNWYDGWIPFPSLPNGENLDGGGDPAIAFDRAGVVYYADINFNRDDDTNGVWVSRSTNGGFTWSRPCVAITGASPTDDVATCGGPGDPRQPGDGTVAFIFENQARPPAGNILNFSVTFNDKEYLTTGPRPAGVSPVCFKPETKTQVPAGAPGCPNDIIGVDRVYVTWTSFSNPSGVPGAITDSKIVMSFSDDMARSWSPAKVINGSAPFCTGAFAGGTACDDNQYSVPTVSPATGHLYVAFENFDTPDENQWLVVRSTDGGATFAGPFWVTPAFDVNLRLKADCVARGASRVHLTNSCFRVPMTGAIVADKRSGAFADDLYLVMEDNRNGTRDSTNSDVFFFKSLNGGSTWIGPTRVNDDPSAAPANRDCGRGAPQPACPAGVNTGNDQWWPWIDLNKNGNLNVVFKDRRLDTDSIASEWPTSRARPGNYLVWTWGAQCTAKQSKAADCVGGQATEMAQPTAPVNPSGAYPGAGPSSLGDWDNFGISDVPSNWDYTFRSGIFAGDYEAVASEGHNTYAFFTDARNGRSSGGPAGGATAPSQPGRNPACEQSDVFVDRYGSANASTTGQNHPRGSDALFLVTPCPTDE